MRVIIGIGLALARRDLAQRAGAREHDQGEIGQRGGSPGGIEAKPLLDRVGGLGAGDTAPGAIGRGNRVEQVAIEAIAGAMIGEELVDRPFGQAHHFTQLRFDGLGGPQGKNRVVYWNSVMTSTKPAARCDLAQASLG